MVKSRLTNSALNQIPAAAIVENGESVSHPPLIPSLHSHPKKMPQKLTFSGGSVAQRFGCGNLFI